MSAVAAVRPRTTVCSVWSLVLGILSIALCLTIFTAIPGLILGIIALVRIGKTPDLLKGKGLAIGGIVTSSVGLLLVPLLIAIAVPTFVQHSERAVELEGGSPVLKLETEPPTPLLESKDYHTVDVFYATDRKPAGANFHDKWYGKERNREGRVNYGKTEVSIPLHHRMGIVERPKWYKLEFSEDAKKHVVILKLNEMDSEAYFRELDREAGARPLKEALLFIHGFSVTFDEAVRRTAQISFDLDFGGVALTYSWPADGALSAYVADHGNALWSFPHLSDFLADLQEKADLDKIHVIAHSMGSEILGRALAKARDDGFNLDLNNVILAAPDIDADVFAEQILPKIRGTAQRLTMYASSGDAALKVSQELNGSDRLGLSGDWIKVLEGMDTVDASEIDTSMLGHAYYGSHRVVMEDLLNLIIKGLDPPGRRLVQGNQGQWNFLNLLP